MDCFERARDDGLDDGVNLIVLSPRRSTRCGVLIAADSETVSF